MSLKEVFRNRIERVGRMLDTPDVGPTTMKFESSDLSGPDSLGALHDKFPRKNPGSIYLYQLSIDGSDLGAAARARSAFRAARATSICKMCRDNNGHEDSKSLYVGTSLSMYDRFRTHLGRGEGTTTWALYLSKWAVPLNASFVVEYYEFKDAASEDVELLEGMLWDSLRPLCGKKGGR